MSAQFPGEQSNEGQFKRQQDAFRHWVGTPEFPAEAGRYHLYVSWACPWAHRTIIARVIKGLQTVVGLTAVDPVRDDRGWAFTPDPDPLNGWAFLSEAYHATDPAFRGRYTVPVLWDKQTKRIVSNSDDDILRMFQTAFTGLATGPDLFPEAHRDEIDALNERIYNEVNNGVYKAGFATSQRAYEASAFKVFNALDELEGRLATRRFLITDHPVETDWRLFPTLVRFDAVYHGHFKCNLRTLASYPHLAGYMRDLYQQPGVGDTVRIDEIKRHYYITQDKINPTQVVPIGPLLDFSAPPNRDHLS
ncbi:MAG: yqjG [Cyanobacteria bacterium RYN_339]|nr:yqjG [Cyanobacteria bacterium RYN_339]